MANKPPSEGTPMRWVTQQEVRLDRAATIWLILRHIDTSAEIDYLDGLGIAEATSAGAMPFHNTNSEGVDRERTSFSQLLVEYKLDSNPGLALLADIVLGAELADSSAPPESAGLAAVLKGIRRVTASDTAMVELTLPIFDALYAYCQEQAGCST